MKRSLWLGDLIAWLILTLIGFASHGELQPTAWPRMLATFLPLIIAWFPLAYLLDLLRPPSSLSLSYLLKLSVTVVYTVSLAVLLRAAWLNSAAVPIFALVLSLTSILGMIVWRLLYFVAFKSRRALR